MSSQLHFRSVSPVVPLHTARLLLRPYHLADAPVFFAVLEADHQRLQPAFPARVAAVRTLADAERVLETFGHDWRTRRLYVLGIWEQAAGRYLGDISLKPNWSAPVTLEIGYYLAAEAEGNGYAREALQAAVQFGFSLSEEVARLLIRCRADNPRSCAVAQAAGFKQLPARPRPWPLRALHPEEILYFTLKREDRQAAL
ncbi:GNAT family N-acetyltransferase [Hymenobacter lutimineralis]|uniref:GNAT family N-acetyltransferase n=1 Tax=Hymenobacter lutimineralis TaxID=2606448 RepID=A0A5D6V2T6_9BACT|nr:MULTISPECIES: GNAT family N-acetyltransferase [Hymenobacter]QIX61001.1 GNAT family N-acetyltransferase [Hymenobacter sp. BT18]TYZ09637.1 GNAT family N-acetyltransferase [Hymenobacter lutimineralis]